LVLELIAGDVALAAQFEQSRSVNRDAVGEERGRVAVTAADPGGPQLLAGGGIVALELEGHAEEELVLLADASDDRRAPRTEKAFAGQPRVATGFGHLPDFLAGLLVDGK